MMQVHILTTLVSVVAAAAHHRHHHHDQSNLDRYSQVQFVQENGFKNKRGVPDFVQKFYDQALQGKCENILASGFMGDDRSYNSVYCTTAKKECGVFGRAPGKLVNMDVDCDGDQSDSADGRCGSDHDTTGETTFIDHVSKFGVPDLNANYIPYIVFGNDRPRKFRPEDYGIEPLSVVAVVCNNKLVYGVWGDTCGASEPLVGEASLSLATACFGPHMNGDSGHDRPDVLFMAFPGKEAVPGPQAKWDARSFQEFEDSITPIGDALIKRLL